VLLLVVVPAIVTRDCLEPPGWAGKELLVCKSDATELSQLVALHRFRFLVFDGVSNMGLELFSRLVRLAASTPSPVIY
jgi:hypothetical protein